MFTVNEVESVIARRRESIKRLWCDEMVNGIAYYEVEASVQSVGNLGRDVSRAREMLAEGHELYRAERYDDLLALIGQINQALREAPWLNRPATPTDLPGIRAGWPAAPIAPRLDPALYYDKVLAGWQGKNIGCALGGLLEGWTREAITERYGFIEDYVLKPPSTLNDDITFEILFLHTLETHGLDATSAQIGWEWVAHLPLEYCYVAEKVAVINLMRGVVPPESGRLDNPFCEWVGGQMKGEVCGLIAPGRPDLAAEYGYRDGIVAHDGEGVYGEIFSAAATAAAFTANDAESAILTALDYIPAGSRYSAAVRQALDWCHAEADWQAACARIEDTLAREYHWVHVLPNAQAVIVALMFGQGDFTRTIAIATGCGLDVDTNGGVAGAMAGVLAGTGGIPAHLSGQIGDTIDTWITGFERMELGDLARRTCTLGQRLLAERGGAVA